MLRENSAEMDNKEEVNNGEINPDDVLCGRGGLTNSHVGNRKFRHIVAEYQREYLVARKKEKRDIAERVVARIHENGGRFLKMDKQRDGGSVWSEVPRNKAVGKTSQALREGLDVRRKTVRPKKLVRRLDDVVSSGELLSTLPENPRKRAKLVRGLVGLSSAQPPMPLSHPAFAPPHPVLRGEDVGGDVPDLRDEPPAVHAFEPMFSFHPHAMMQLMDPALGNIAAAAAAGQGRYHHHF